MIHTVVECAVSPGAYSEIKSALMAAGYHQAITDETIDTHGLALVVRPAEGAAPAAAAPHPEELAQWRLGAQRYEKARGLKPVQWIELHKRNLNGDRFDRMLDALPAAAQGAPK